MKPEISFSVGVTPVSRSNTFEDYTALTEWLTTLDSLSSYFESHI